MAKKTYPNAGMVPKDGMFMVSPQVAAHWLSMNDRNRPHRQRRSTTFAQIIKGGDWMLTHQGIAFSTKGLLLDGQHRLGGIVMSGKTVPMLVTTGLDPKTFLVIDTGLKRTGSDTLGLLGGKNTCLYAATIGIEHRVNGGKGLTNQEMERLYKKFNADGEVDMAEVVSIVNSAKKSLRGWLHLRYFSWVIWRAYGHDDTAAEVFLEQVTEGVGLKKGDPVLALRRQLSAQDPESDTVAGGNNAPPRPLYLLCKAWEHFIAGTKVSAMKMPKAPTSWLTLPGPNLQPNEGELKRNRKKKQT